jgi:tRNA dimethylallyltransferase
VALVLAERLGAELIAMDAMSVYRGMDVGTAKPSEGDRVRVPHHCIDVVDPWKHYDVGCWTRDALAALEDCAARGGVPAIVVGGTGLYLRACVEGLAPLPASDEAVRAQLIADAEREGPDALHERLRAIDPASADRLHPNDVKRVSRALEVHLVSGRTLTDWHAETQPLLPGARVAVLERSDDDLRERIEARTDAMLAGDALLEEMKNLQASCGAVGRGLAKEPEQAVGYLEAAKHLAGEIDRDTMRAEIIRRTWYLKRKQGTWAKSLSDAVRIPVAVDASPEAVASEILAATSPA